jgi:predicted permease
VAAREFFGERVQTPPDYWIPLSFQPQILQSESWLNARNVYWLNYMGRLKPGRTIHSANTEVNLRLHQFYTAQAGTHLAPATRQKIQNAHVNLKPGGTGISGLRFLYSQPLHILMAVVGLVLLIACANIAILLLARASARQQELLARIALGASRRRLIRQLLTESVLLSIIGGAVGVVVAYWCVKGLVLLLQVSSAVKVQPDWSVLAFTIGISILTGIAFGIIPAIRYSGIDPRGATAVRPPEFGKSRFGSASALIVLQVALSLILLIGAGMLAHSLLALETQNLGFHQNRTLVVSTSPRLAGYQPKQLYPLYREMDQRLNALPGVVSAALAQYTPVSGTSSSSNFSMEGYTPAPGKEMNLFGLAVGPRFFETLGIPVLSGRTIGPRDIPATPAVAVVNETFVKQYLPHRNPIGQHIYLGSQFKSPGVEIVGVVADSKYYDLRKKPEPMVFSAVWQGKQFAIYAGNLIIRTQGDPASVIPEVKQMLNSIDSRLPILDITTLDRQIANSLKEQKMITTLCSIFGILALVLASIGIYGTMAYSVARRTTEIGIRMALGAQRGQVLWMILRDSVLLISAGLVVGFPLALAGTHWIRSFLFGVPAADPVAIGSAVVLIAILAMVAGYLPARRASRIDPMSAIRYE